MQKMRLITVEEITNIVNNVNINNKEITSKTISRLLNKLANENSQDEFLKRKKDNTQSGKGRKKFLYNINYVQKVIEHFHSDFYLFNNETTSNKIRKVLLNVKKLNNHIIEPIDGLLRDLPQEREALKDRMNKANNQINNIIQKEMYNYEFEIQKTHRQQQLLQYKSNIINDILEISNLDDKEKIEYIKKVQVLRDYPIIAKIRREVRIKKAQSNNFENSKNEDKSY